MTYPDRPASGNQTFSLAPRSLDEAIEYAKLIADSEIAPSDYRGKPNNILVAVQMGAELGLPPMQALQNIAVINGRPAVWGDALMAIARAHPACEYITETFDAKTMTATCKVKRRGGPEEVRTFSQREAELAGLWGRRTWQQYPKRMLQMRARGYAIRDVFPDALKGLAVAEEAQDMPPRKELDMGAITPEVQEPVSLPVYPEDRYSANLPKWRELIEAGAKTAEEIIAMVESSYQLTDEQKQSIAEPEPKAKPRAKRGTKR